VGAGKRAHVLDDEVAVAGQVVAEEVDDDLIHGLRVKDAAADRQHEDDEREERQDGVGGNREGVGVDLGLGQVLDGVPAAMPDQGFAIALEGGDFLAYPAANADGCRRSCGC
jgi:plasmid stability protein